MPDLSPNERRWTLNVCPECGSAVVPRSPGLGPEFTANCRHADDSSGGWDKGRNVKRVPVEVMPVPPAQLEVRQMVAEAYAVAMVGFRDWHALNGRERTETLELADEFLRHLAARGLHITDLTGEEGEVLEPHGTMSYLMPIVCWLCFGKGGKDCPNIHCPHKGRHRA